MNRSQRIAIVLVGVAAVVIAFIVLSPGDDSGDGTNERVATTAPPITATAPAPTGTTRSTTPKPAPAPEVPLLVKGKVREVNASSGAIVRFRVRSSVPEEVHVHGYDITSPIEAGATVRLAFKARLEGIFEIELHRSGEQIGKLVVEP